MRERNQEGSIKPLKDDQTSKGHGRQGIDKAQGEETPSDMENVVADTQKGKNKVDGDPSLESDRPVEQQ
jgi:hypothetical protein